jgi:catechol 2,3-dioxygenase-like lactoylglutathione lyase family enzyme
VEAVTTATGLPDAFEWAPLVPELLVSDLDESLAFWCGMLGFRIAYDRSEERFVYLDLAGAQLMLEERSETQRQWLTAGLSAPFGRGINFQVQVPDCEPALARLAGAGWPLFGELEEAWYRVGDADIGVRQFLVQDPDGYLVRMSSPLGEKPRLKSALQ